VTVVYTVKGANSNPYSSTNPKVLTSVVVVTFSVTTPSNPQL